MERIADDLPMLYATGTDGNLHFVDDVENGLACKCTCPACGQPLVARNGGTKLIHHFAHRTNACAWAIEAIVSGLAADALRDAGRIRLPALYYHDVERDAELTVSGPLTMAVAEVAEEAISGRGVPDLLVTVSARSTTRTFALVCTLTHRLTEVECVRLMEKLPGVLVLDLASDLRRRRAELGKHYDRIEVLRSYQDPELVRECLADEEGLLVWAANERAAKLERESEERHRAELERRRKAAERHERERKEQERRAAERDAERRQKRAEEENDRRERRRAEREAERERKRQEKAAREELERQEMEELHRLTEEVVAAREEVSPIEIPCNTETLDAAYDVRTWPELTRLQRGVLCTFGSLRALVSERDGRRRHAVLAELRPFEVREVANHLAELKGVADEFSVVLVAEMAHIAHDIVAVHTEQGITWFEVMTPALLDALTPLEAIFACGVPVTVNLTQGAGGKVCAVMPDRGLFALVAKNTGVSGS